MRKGQNISFSFTFAVSFFPFGLSMNKRIIQKRSVVFLLEQEWSKGCSVLKMLSIRYILSL